VVLFDEIEKAHPDVFNTLLQILEDGRLTDGQGRIVDFKNTVLILTTNLGTKDVGKAVSLGFQSDSSEGGDYDRMKEKVNEELKNHFRPEFLNRIDDTIVFPKHSQEAIVAIVDLMVKRIEDQLTNRDMALELTDNAKLYLGHKGYDPVMGARPLRRTIQREIEDTLSEKILFNEFVPGQIVIVDVDGDPKDVEKTNLTFRAADKPAGIPDTPPAELAGERAPKSPGAGTGTMPPKSPGAGPRGGQVGQGGAS
jgi:ATP-dependent Clp protease ATP-binding subunit ClpC